VCGYGKAAFGLQRVGHQHRLQMAVSQIPSRSVTGSHSGRLFWEKLDWAMHRLSTQVERSTAMSGGELGRDQRQAVPDGSRWVGSGNGLRGLLALATRLGSNDRIREIPFVESRVGPPRGETAGGFRRGFYP
jgi:hypothetical protein